MTATQPLVSSAVLILMVAGVQLLATPPAQAKPSAELELTGMALPIPCTPVSEEHQSLSDNMPTEDCMVVGAFSALGRIRLIDPLFIEPLFQVQVVHQLDAPAVYWLAPDAESPQPMTDRNIQIGFGAGIEPKRIRAKTPQAQGAVRVRGRFGGGVSLNIAGLTPETTARLEPLGLWAAVQSRVSLQAFLHGEVEVNPGRVVMLSGGVFVTIGSEVGFTWHPETEPEEKLTATTANRDTEIMIYPRFRLSFPTKQPIGFYMEGGPILMVSVYSPSDYQALNEQEYWGPNSQQENPTLDVVGALLFGVQLRLGKNLWN